MKNRYKFTKISLIIIFVLMAFLLGIVVGKDAGERAILEKISVLFAGANIDMDIDINETLLVQEMNETFYPAIKEKLERCCDAK